jgi:L-asparaginase
MSPRKSVYIAYTGGTIGMDRGDGGYRPAPGFLGEQMGRIPVLQRGEVPRYEIHEFQPLLDSSNMTPREWVKIGEAIHRHYGDYDGFIVLHGTDTMAYSASALSFMFQNLDKPILFTGSQVPLMEIRTDARENLINSLLLAAAPEIREVCLFVGNRLLRGNRATKVSADRFLAFESPNYPPLGHAEVQLEIDRRQLLRRPAGELGFHPVRYHGADIPQVAAIRLFPGIAPTTLERFLGPPLQGAVLHSYGVGNAPDDPDLLGVLRRATDRGVVIVNCTQCLHGSVRMTEYATGRALAAAGVTSGYDMTPEAALTKLYYLFSLDLDPDGVRRRMQQNLRGELTPIARS